MSSYKSSSHKSVLRAKIALVALMMWSGLTQAGAGYVLGISGEADDADGRSVSGFADYGFTENTWLSTAIARTSTDGAVGGLDTVYADIGLEHSFGLAGIRVAAAYWGNDDILDSADIRTSVFLRGKKGSLSVKFERRDFDFVFRPLLFPDEIRTVEFFADGIGIAAGVQVSDNIRLFANGMNYNYSQNIRLQPRIDSLQLFSLSRLSLVNSLIDHRVSGGIAFRFGKKSIELTFSNWQIAIDGASVDSIALGFVTPFTPATDFEVRLAFDHSENFGETVALALTLYYFGG